MALDVTLHPGLQRHAEDQVWITVVATGYGDKKPPRRDDSSFREPAGEPRVSRIGRPEPARRERSSIDVDVPEYIPRF